MLLLVVVLVCAVAGAGTPRLKSMEEVFLSPTEATAMELNLATLDLMAMSIRLAASTGDRDNMHRALVHLRDTANMMLKNCETPTPAKAP